MPPDPKYKIVAELTPIEKKETVTLATNTGEEQRYLEYAFAEFDLDGLHHKLLILEVMDSGPFRGKLFFAFGDETSAVETYGAGTLSGPGKGSGQQYHYAWILIKPIIPIALTYQIFPARCRLLKIYSTIPIKAGEKTYH